MIKLKQILREEIEDRYEPKWKLWLKYTCLLEPSNSDMMYYPKHKTAYIYVYTQQGYKQWKTEITIQDNNRIPAKVEYTKTYLSDNQKDAELKCSNNNITLEDFIKKYEMERVK